MTLLLVLIAVIVVSVILHFLTIRVVMRQFRLIGELGDEISDLERELKRAR